MSGTRIRTPSVLLRSLIGIAVAISSPVLPAQAGSSCVSLAGQWRFALDDKNEGLAGQWFTRTPTGVIHLPGSVDEAGVATQHRAADADAALSTA